ncbi:hypothetical protein P691DRAFT_718277 [Macrolepiota fuliginosa MF-IS2]|uniref:YCII-related domain-containing protein n=1 Tax=Macrolepiota fuliginosa MF-IS2 TaxID=1400762 RepID=A0A9P6C6D6_9AGAR|nr:hypothetical protein P691DRAFT_718277 [Macrolepiota fuliginosa MF-IS2]
MLRLSQCVTSSLPRARLFHATASRVTPLNKYFVYAPDYPNNVAHRYTVRESHLKDVKPLIEDGTFRVAGIIADPAQPTVTINNETRINATGSILIVEAETLEDVRKLIEKDIYWRKGVWDKEKMTIQPFFAATPFP